MIFVFIFFFFLSKLIDADRFLVVTTDYRLYGHDITTATATATTTNAQVAHSSSSNIHQNGNFLRPFL